MNADRCVSEEGGGEVRVSRFKHKFNALVANSSGGRLMIISIKKMKRNKQAGRKIRADRRKDKE